mmetsp:Transcript_47568/g.113246  ORF Transcript_47568/g.113246 Transcript_47568/m.113246 type:complete len:218 (-) Transcript_47568:129-782(-)
MTVPERVWGPWRPALSTTLAPSIQRCDPSSERVENVYSPPASISNTPAHTPTMCSASYPGMRSFRSASLAKSMAVNTPSAVTARPLATTVPQYSSLKASLPTIVGSWINDALKPGCRTTSSPPTVALHVMDDEQLESSGKWNPETTSAVPPVSGPEYCATIVAPSRTSNQSARTVWKPADRRTSPLTVPALNGPPFLTRSTPSTHRRDPSSEVVENS